MKVVQIGQEHMQRDLSIDERAAAVEEVQLTPLFQAFIKQIFEFWLTPELEKRKREGRWTDDTWMQVAQILFKDDKTEIRLNSEVHFTFAADPAVPFVPGEPVYAHQVGRIEEIKLHDSDGDAGHITIFNLGLPQIAFDFRRYKKSALELAGLSNQFLETAAFAFERGAQGPFLDNLFSACELLAKAKLMTMSLIKKDARTHGALATALNKFGRSRSISNAFVTLFNQLSSVRAGARYNPARLKPIGDETKALDLVRLEVADFVRIHHYEKSQE